jgi:hypothetical protein
VQIIGGRWYREIDRPVPLGKTGIQAIELMIQRERYTEIRQLDDGEYGGLALIEWRSGVGHELAIFEWEAS